MHYSRLLSASFFITAISFASTVNIDLNNKHQTIRGFGGMVHNTWQGGKGLSEADAKIAFGFGDGQIGLNTLRIPINKNTSDFGKEVEAAKYAKKYAGKDFILFATPWDSPYAGGNTHLAVSDYQNYTNHLNSFAGFMKEQGVPLYAISISNEPDWCHEWTCFSADEIYNYTKNYGDQLRKHGTKVISPESFAYQKKLYDKVLNDSDALKNWDILGAHFYASTASTSDDFFKYPLADNKNVERWMTEHYTESQGSGNYWRKVLVTGDQATASKLDTVRALDVAYEIHRGLVLGNFSQYTWWYIRRCYGLIMEKDFSGKLQIAEDEIGKPSKRGYVMSQFARFIRPGSVRVEATNNPEAEVYASAYTHGDSVIVVLINRDYGKTKTIDINIPLAKNITTYTKYVTSETKNALKETAIQANNGKISLTLDKESITTLVGYAPKIIVPQKPFLSQAISIPGIIEAENYDFAGTEDASYFDKDMENKGDANFRTEEGVDIVKTDSGFAVGYTEAGEWIEYSINVQKSGDYQLSFKVSSGNETSSLRFAVNQHYITDTIPIAKTSEEDWNTYKEISYGSVHLDSGLQILKLEITGSFFNIDWLKFSEINSETENETSLFQRNFQQSEENYKIFDLKGNYLGHLKAKSISEIKTKAKTFIKNTGVYFIKNEIFGNVFKMQITK